MTRTLQQWQEVPLSALQETLTENDFAASYDDDELETPADEELCLVAAPAVEPPAMEDIQQFSLFAVSSDDDLSESFRFARTSADTY